jgi:hypothetical protein
MPGSRALKEVTLCKSHGGGGKKESAPKIATKQFTNPKVSNSGPNYPQWNFGSGKPITKV